MACSVCSEKRELRLGACWECATMESIIHDGLDMYDKGPNGDEIPAKTSMEKLIFMRKKNPNYFNLNKEEKKNG